MENQTTDIDNIFAEYSEAHKEWEKEYLLRIERERKLLKPLGRKITKYIRKLMKDCNFDGEIEKCDPPTGVEGMHKDEPFWKFKKIYIEQWEIGDSGDSYQGIVYVQIKNIWLKIPYTC